MDVRLPDGTIVRNVPEGSTQDELLSMVSGSRGGSSLQDALDKIDRQQAAPQAPQFNQDGTAYLAQQVKKGVAATLGMPVDFTTNLLNLGIAGYGVGKNLLTGSSDLPEPITNPVGGSGTFERMFLTNDAIQPTGEVNRVAGRVVRDLSGAAVPTAAMARYPTVFMPRFGTPSPVQALQAQTANPLPTVAAGGGLSVLSSLGGETGRAVAPAPYKDAADMAGQLVGGIAVPAMIASRIDAVNQLRDATRDNNVNRLAGQHVQDQILGDVRNYPSARDKLNEALTLQDDIQGFQPRIGQASGVPSLMDMEHRVAVAGPEQFNKRAIQDAAQRQAISQYAERGLPILKQNDLDQRLALVQGERANLADALPQVAANETGQTLRAARDSMKARYDFQAAEKFDAPIREAEKLRVLISPTNIVAKADELLSNPILKWDPTNAPNVVRRVNALNGADAASAGLLDASGKLIQGSTLKLPFAELKGLREAVNQDIARESTLMSPNSRQRLRALVEMREAIDDSAMQAPESVRKLWSEARDWYRDVYAPKFLRGINLKQTSKDITGELRISDERLPGQYFKKMASTPMDRFLKLYGDSPQAMRAMDDHILDTYRREVVKDGFIDPKKHEIFLQNYEPSLKQLPTTKSNLESMGSAARILSEKEIQLADAQKVISRGALNALYYDDPQIQGLDPKKVNAYLNRHGQEFKDAVAAAYSPKEAEQHFQNLQKIAKATEIADRGALHPAAQPQQSTNPFDLRKSVGFSSRTVFNMIRAVTTGRTSAEDMAFTLGAQSATHRIGQALIKAEERAISDPQTAKLVADSLNQPITTEAGKNTLLQLLQKGGLYIAKTATGANNYERMGRYRAVPFAIEANKERE